MTAVIHGDVAPGFEPVADAFRSAFDGRPDMGAALSIRHEGRLVARLWGGLADPRSGRPWEAGTPSVIFSCTKGLMSLMIAQLVEDEKLDYDAPVASYWPEFAAAAKSAVTLRHLAAHQAGLSAPRCDLSLEQILDWSQVTSYLAHQVPLWVPGQGYAYHAITHGWLLGEVLRRVTGESVSQYFRRRVTGPLGADVWIGLPADLEPRVAHLFAIPDANPGPAPDLPGDGVDWPLRALTLGNALPPGLITETGGFNDPRVHAAEIPGAGGIATADGLAAIWSAAVTPTEGVRLLGPEIVARATEVVSEGPPVFPANPPFPRWGMGFMLDSDHRRLLGPKSFGHDGAGGQVAFADPVAKVGFAFITNQMEGGGDPRGNAIVTALRDVLGAY